MQRQYLYVPPEEYAAVRAAGASWDEASKRWFVADDAALAACAGWLEEADELPFTLESSAARVAAAWVQCAACGAELEVIALFCESGVDLVTGEALERFTVSNVSAVDERLRGALRAWPGYREGEGQAAGGSWANYCSCGTVVEDFALHSEPGDVFFGLTGEAGDGVEYVGLEGVVRVSGDVGYCVTMG